MRHDYLLILRFVAPRLTILALCASVVGLLIPGAARADISVGELRCEYLEDPLGIDVRAPRLSWIITSDERGQRQTAYRILVASSPQKLKSDEGDIWDSGRVESDASIQVRYAGTKIESHGQSFWKVRVWDKAGVESAWSEPARWTMGLLDPSDWQAQWIGIDRNPPPHFLADTNWIWFPEGNPIIQAPTETRYFRRKFTLPSDRMVTKATLRFTADDRCTMILNGLEIGSRSDHQSAMELDVTHRVQSGENILAVNATNDGSSPNPAALAAWMKIEFDRGDPLVVVTDELWKASNAEAVGWTEFDFDDSEWATVRKLGSVGIAPWGQVRRTEDRRLPARYLRKEFAIDKNVRRATVYFSGLGLSELYLNGEKIGDHVLSPGTTQYPKRLLYVAFDVTDRLRHGENAIGVVLGNGQYYSPRGEVFVELPTYGYPKLLLHFRIEHTDGTVTTIVSDPSWKLSTDGPILANNEYDGEEYDARKEFGDWTSPGFDDTAWQPAQLSEVPTGELRSQMIDPIRVTETLKPIAVNEVKPGVYIFDMGQNMVGWCRLRVRGPAGTQIRLVHAETLLPDGNLYLANIRGARVTDIYTTRGEGLEEWEPRFTYHGFRYVKVTGWPGKPTINDLDGRVVHDDLRVAGAFACSNTSINQIYKNVVWGVRGNYRSVPTDCPQRDERQGWLGDRGEESRGEMYIFDGAALYSKWLQDMEDAQKDSGSVPDVCPAHWPIYSDNVTWPSTSVIIPSSLYRQYGDSAIIARHYNSAKQWIDYMLTFVKDGIIDRDQYGDWCVPPEDPTLILSKDPLRQTNKSLLATSYFYYDLRLMERYARLLGKEVDAARFAMLAQDMKTAFNKAFFNRELGQYDNGSQTSCVLPLYFGMVPDEQRERLFEYLIRKITVGTNSHIGTGLIGGQFLNRVLSDGGRPDLAYTIAAQMDYPSWGYMISKGATTIWELWNGDTGPPGMNSGNHVMLVGDLVVWFYEYLAGIRPDEAKPGFKHVVMRPEPVAGLDWVRASHRTPYGLVESSWQKKGDTFAWQITIPANATATVYLPTTDAASVTEGGRPLAESKCLEFVGLKDGRVELRLGSGKYEFLTE